MTAAPAFAAPDATAAAAPRGRTRGHSGRRTLLAMLALLLAAVIPAVVAPTFMCNSGTELPDLGRVPAFELVDHTGARFTEDALRGHPTIVGFIFTRCDTICPVITQRMAKVHDKTNDRKGAAIKLVSISVDPAYDTPERLRAYAAQHGADPARWRFLTGNADTLKALVEGPFMGEMRSQGVTPSGAPNISHSGYLMLVDGDLVIRGVYDSNDIQRLDKLMHDGRYLARTHRSYKFGGGE